MIDWPRIMRTFYTDIDGVLSNVSPTRVIKALNSPVDITLKIIDKT